MRGGVAMRASVCARGGGYMGETDRQVNRDRQTDRQPEEFLGVDELFYNVRVRLQTLDSQRAEDLGLREKREKMETWGI